MSLDLHIHTCYSDGDKTPFEIVQMAKQRNITRLSICDHDSTAGLNEGKKYANENDITFYNGIEISCIDKKDTHILGYCFDKDNKNLSSKLQELKDSRKQRAIKIVDALKKDGINIDISQRIEKGEIIGRPHIANELIRLGFGKDIREVFSKYLGKKCKYYITYEKLSVEDGIRLIKESGGLAFLAHPKLLQYNTYDMKNLIHKYVDFGLDGIETYYPCHYKSDVDYYLKMANEFNLLVSAGGDYHNDKDKTKDTLGFEDDLPMMDKTIQAFERIRR